jgi:hypothetical protein
MKSLQYVLATLLAVHAAACVADASTDPESTEESDLGSARRHLRCHLEYARYSPDFKTVPAATFDELMSTIKEQGATASDGRFSLVAQVNPTPPYNLAFQIAIRDLSTGKTVAYGVLPPPRLGGDYLFELGARITPLALPGVVADEQFDFTRSYCSLYLAE